MNTGRMEAFSDGVIAVALTVMVLEIDVPEGTQLTDLLQILPQFLTYVLSFIYIGIYWSNHHHLLQAADKVSGRVLWANLHLLFWLTLIPLTTAWMDGHLAAALPTAVYGVVLLFAALAYYLLAKALISVHDDNHALKKALGADYKNRLSIVLYLAGILLAFVSGYVAAAFYVLVAVIWLVPDRRIEKHLGDA